MARYKFNIEPATDDRPYFFHFFKWAVLPEILALRGQGGLPLLESGYLVMVATLLQAALISGLFILLPLGMRRWQPTAQSFPLRRDRIVVYFFAIGLAFLFIEIAFIQTFILFLDHPLYAVATVLTAFLVFAGLGSASIAHFRKEAARPSRLAGKAVAGIIGLGIAYSFLLGPLCDSLMTLPLALRVIAQYSADRTAGLLHGHAVSPRAGAYRRRNAGIHTLGVGHQRLRLGRERRHGVLACDPVWLYGCHHLGLAVVPGGGIDVPLTPASMASLSTGQQLPGPATTTTSDTEEIRHAPSQPA